MATHLVHSEESGAALSYLIREEHESRRFGRVAMNTPTSNHSLKDPRLNWNPLLEFLAQDLSGLLFLSLAKLLEEVDSVSARYRSLVYSRRHLAQFDGHPAEFLKDRRTLAHREIPIGAGGARSGNCALGGLARFTPKIGRASCRERV